MARKEMGVNGGSISTDSSDCSWTPDHGVPTTDRDFCSFPKCSGVVGLLPVRLRRLDLSVEFGEAGIAIFNRNVTGF